LAQEAQATLMGSDFIFLGVAAVLFVVAALLKAPSVVGLSLAGFGVLLGKIEIRSSRVGIVRIRRRRWFSFAGSYEEIVRRDEKPWLYYSTQALWGSVVLGLIGGGMYLCIRSLF
jgi:hypothetical protein